MIDASIQAYLRAAASRARDLERIGPFLATFSHISANPYLNYAIPDDDARPGPGDVAALIAAFRRRERRPRLEYLPRVAPLAERALVAGGFAVEGRLSLMVYVPGAARDYPPPQGIELVAPGSDEELLAMIAVQNEAYDDATDPRTQLEERRAHLAAGGIAILARDRATGEAAGGGLCDVPAGGVSELTSVGVRAPFRRRGIAAALAERLAREAGAAGVDTLFLMAGHAEGGRIYARVGFAPATEVLHISVPSAIAE